MLCVGALLPIDRALASGATSPSPRLAMAMAYDAARGEVLLFGGTNGHRFQSDTWSWDGAAWTQQRPITSPPARAGASMTFDAARAEVVLFGGCCDDEGEDLEDTWTFDGATWAKHQPATSPAARAGASMTFDAERGEVVLFGGAASVGRLRDTWTWDGTNWTRRHPATSPPQRDSMGMTYDAARSEVVLFGGVNGGGLLGDTWTWDGTTWTRRYPATSPSARWGFGMTYDAAHGQVVLFGACCDHRDTWTWDGATWTRQHPPTSPSARGEIGMVFDAARGEAVLFGGNSDTGRLGDTWTWDGTHWRVPFVARLHLFPRSGLPGTSVRVKGTGFAAGEQVTLTFIDSVSGKTPLGRFTTNAMGSLHARIAIPISATVGPQRITGVGGMSRQKAEATFTVT